MNAVAEPQIDRDEILRQIEYHKSEMESLQAMLPTVYRTLYIFVTRPEKRVWIYAESLEEAKQKLFDRMNQNYGANWEVASSKVFKYDDPEEACRNAPTSLLRCISPEDAQLLILDYRANQRGKYSDPKATESQLERDILNYERGLNAREK